MSLADRLATSTNLYSKNSQCQTCRFLSSLTDEDRQAVDDWIANGQNVNELWRHCREEGLDITYRNFMAHFEKGPHHGPR